MADLGLAVRLTLAIIFGWASIGKSRQPGQLSRFLATVGIPRSVSGPLGIVVICAEALVAGGFALSVSFPSFAIPAALAATTLSLCFVGFAARARYVRWASMAFCALPYLPSWPHVRWMLPVSRRGSLRERTSLDGSESSPLASVGSSHPWCL